MADEIVEHEDDRAGAFQQRSHDPEIRAPARGRRFTIRNQVTDRDRQEKDAVEIGVDGRGRERDVEELREQRPPRQHHDADGGVVDQRNGRNQSDVTGLS